MTTNFFITNVKFQKNQSFNNQYSKYQGLREKETPRSTYERPGLQ